MINDLEIQKLLERELRNWENLDLARLDVRFNCFGIDDLAPLMIGSYHELKSQISQKLIPLLFYEENLCINASLKLLQIPQISIDMDISHPMALRSELKIQKVESKPVVFKFVNDFSQIPKAYHHCSFCDGYTKNDVRGNCLACGGPRGGL